MNNDNIANKILILVKINDTNYVKLSEYQFMHLASSSISIPNKLPSIHRNGICDEIEGIAPEGFAESNITKITLSDNIRVIGKNAFDSCQQLREIIFPDYLDEIGVGAFADCSKLVNIQLPYGIKNLPDSLFYGCASLSNVAIPDSVKNIENGVFKDCTNLKSIILPKSLEEVSSTAFHNCNGIIITYKGTYEKWQQILKNKPLYKLTNDNSEVLCEEDKNNMLLITADNNNLEFIQDNKEELSEIYNNTNETTKKAYLNSIENSFVKTNDINKKLRFALIKQILEENNKKRAFNTYEIEDR